MPRWSSAGLVCDRVTFRLYILTILTGGSVTYRGRRCVARVASRRLLPVSVRCVCVCVSVRADQSDLFVGADQTPSDSRSRVWAVLFCCRPVYGNTRASRLSSELVHVVCTAAALYTETPWPRD